MTNADKIGQRSSERRGPHIRVRVESACAAVARRLWPAARPTSHSAAASVPVTCLPYYKTRCVAAVSRLPPYASS